MTMRELDQARLSPVPPLRPAEIKRIRETVHVSQAVCQTAHDSTLELG
jgi:putative transcriptional regulator